MSNSLEYPNKKRTFAYRVVRRSKSQNISALALSLNRYHKSATPSFQSDTQSDISFLIIQCKNTKKFCTFASSFGTMFGNNRECASFLVKIAKSKTKNTRGTEQLIYVGCLPCVYSGVWRYLQGCKVAVHVLFTNKHCKISPIVCPRRAL